MDIFSNLEPAIIDNQRPYAAHAFNKAGGHMTFVVGPTYAKGINKDARQLLRLVEGGQPVRRAFLSAFFDHCLTAGHAPFEPKQDREDPKAVFITLKLPENRR